MLPEKIREALREKRKMTADEYFQLPETNIHMELIAGELIVYDGQEGNMPAPKDLHQKISSRLFAFFLKYLDTDQLRHAPCDIKLDSGNIVQPDILWVNPQNDQCVLMDDGYLHGAPDFVVEILSPSNTRRDKIDKFYLYEQYGVHEYWIVNPEEQYIEVYIRKENTLHYQGGYKMGQTFVSHILNGATVDLSTLLG
ncbi:MAG: Uma2 family endonuclease [Phototrophicales bacterium]|nr:Uma2 family endonuclease [Phototrophicales bacterium]